MNITRETGTHLFANLSVPGLFITEHLSSLTGNQVKTYLYLLFLRESGSSFTEEELSSALNIAPEEIKETMEVFRQRDLLQKKGKDVFLPDVRQQFLQHHYIQRALPLSEKEEGKKDAISSIGKQFFQGLMGLAWYSDIELWFSQYNFDEDVMFSLFNHCSEKGKLTRAYVAAVAKNWFEAGIRNHFDLEKYFGQHKRLQDMCAHVARRLKRKAPFTEFETDYIRKWVMDYGFREDVIDLALGQTTRISNPNLEYVNKILSSWHAKGWKNASHVNREQDLLQTRKDYRKLRQKNLKLMEDRKLKLFCDYPELQVLNDEIADLSIRAVSLSKNKKAQVLEQIRKKEELFRASLQSKGFETDYLDPVFTCGLCRDTGLLPEGNPCGCSKT